MGWLVQINVCNSSNPQSLGGVSPPWALYQGSVLDPLGDLKRSLDPSPTHVPPNPKSWIRPWYPLVYLPFFDWLERYHFHLILHLSCITELLIIYNKYDQAVLSMHTYYDTGIVIYAHRTIESIVWSRVYVCQRIYYVDLFSNLKIIEINELFSDLFVCIDLVFSNVAIF
jgi:hypothetical protein